MSAKHRLLVPPDAIKADRVQFADPHWRQLRDVLRLRHGDKVRVFDGVQGCDFVVELVDAQAGRIVEHCPQPPEPRHALHAYPALLQRDKFESVIQKLTEVGAASITPVLTARSLVRDPPDDRRIERWRAILREATEQSGRGRAPVLDSALAFAEAIDRAASASRVLLAHTEGGQPIRSALADAGETIALFVGPEGGFTADEADQAVGAGGKLVSLGLRVLRTETASPILAALVLYELGDLSSPKGDSAP